jgi:hypothetical protein
MRIRTISAFFVAAGFMMLAGSALAQVAPNPAAESQWSTFLANHPNVQAGMVNNPSYMANHPGIAQWLEQHPDVASYARQQGQVGSYARQQGQFGGWNRYNQWHERNYHARRFE